MPTVGPQLPPHLAEKRKRTPDPPEDDASLQRSDTPPKRARVAGPTLPPAPLDERPNIPPTPSKDDSTDSSSNDDDFGPALPTSKDAQKSSTASKPLSSAAAPAIKRDDWMTMAPASGDFTARMDPSQLKARKFNTGKGAKNPSTTTSSAPSDSWHETPEQKQTRLRNEMMGVAVKDKHTTNNSAPTSQEPRSEENEATAKRLKQYNTERGPSLYDSHQRSKDKEEDDDPSARAFDREKDIGGGLQINATKRKDMLKRAEGFGSRFATAKYL